MVRRGTVAGRVEALLGVSVAATSAVAGGDICSATRLQLSTGVSVLVKTRPHAPEDFFRTEAAGLRWLGSVEGVDCPGVVAAEEDLLVVEWVESTRPSTEAAERLGRSLSALHRSGAPTFGTRSGTDGYIGTLPLPNRPTGSWAEFFAAFRLAPYLRLARDRRSICASDADAVERVMSRVRDLAGPDEPPARLHGDLWGGNLVWGRDGHVWLVDPAAHGGHRESDLALLALFGCPHLPRVLEVYDESTPLADGWQDRVALHQLFPLLVHAAMFGPGTGYGGRAGAAARSLL